MPTWSGRTCSHRLPIDYGELRMPVEGQRGRVFLFVPTLGYSRRRFVWAFRHERQSAWLDGIDGAFRHFSGVMAEVLVNNARALVIHHHALTREVANGDALLILGPTGPPCGGAGTGGDPARLLGAVREGDRSDHDAGASAGHTLSLSVAAPRADRHLRYRDRAWSPHVRPNNFGTTSLSTKGVGTVACKPLYLDPLPAQLSH